MKTLKTLKPMLTALALVTLASGLLHAGPQSPAQDDVYKVGAGVTPPSVISRVDPAYSEEARKAGLDGSILLSVVVGTDGLAHDINVVKGLGSGLDEKAVEAVQQWHFKPGLKDGEAVKVRAQIEINFKLLKKQ